MKNIMIFLIALIGLMLIFGNNNLVLTEGMTLEQQLGTMEKNNLDASIRNQKYKNLETSYNKDINTEDFSNIEPFECGGENYAQFTDTNSNDVVNKACNTTKRTAAQRENDNSNYDEVPTPSNPKMTKEALITLKKNYKEGVMTMEHVTKDLNRGIINIKEANYITDGAYSN